jgi:diguanylate cyclase (GGDEF)-like protein/PAS domain S-box-containing protein
MATRAQQVKRMDLADRVWASGRAEFRLREAAASAGIGAWSCDLANDNLSWTPGVYALFGLPMDAALDRREIVQFYEAESREHMERLRSAAILRATPFTLEAEILRPDGDRRWMRLTGEVAKRDGRPVELYGLKQDITEEKKRWDALRRLAERDPLTGLSNRTLFQHQFLDGRPADGEPLAALVLFDVDGFKQINDRFGHAAGDACLEAIGRRLSLSAPDAILAARIGGDEFAILIRDRGQAPALTEAAVRRHLGHLAAPILWNGHVLALSASAGIAFADHPHAYDAEALFAAADAALYRAKHEGKNRAVVAKLPFPAQMLG